MHPSVQHEALARPAEAWQAGSPVRPLLHLDCTLLFKGVESRMEASPYSDSSHNGVF